MGELTDGGITAGLFLSLPSFTGKNHRSSLRTHRAQIALGLEFCSLFIRPMYFITVTTPGSVSLSRTS